MQHGLLQATASLLLSFIYFHLVKNRFSDPTKVQIGWDQLGKVIMNECGRRLSERAVMKENKLRWVWLQQRRLTPNENLARVTTESRSKMQTVTNGCVGQKGDDLCCWETFQHWRPHGVSKIEA